MLSAFLVFFLGIQSAATDRELDLVPLRVKKVLIGEVPCGDYFILTPYAGSPGSKNLFFRSRGNLYVPAGSRAADWVSYVILPAEEIRTVLDERKKIPTVRREGGKYVLYLSATEYRKVKSCLPPENR